MIGSWWRFELWHIDPKVDSCGWFMRAKHGDKKVLERIVERFEYDWDKTFTSEDSGNVYFTGWFCPNGDPYLSVHGIACNLFFMAALEHFGSREKAVKFCQKNLFEILFFAENPFDSLHDAITRKFEDACNEKNTERKRKERIESIASCIYGWILRETRPWYKEPRWHIHHWKLTFIKPKWFKAWKAARGMR